MKECTNKEEFRDNQCILAAKEAYDQKSLKLIGFEGINPNSWKAYYSQDPRRKCTLFCKPDGNSNFVVLKPHVIDGTKCSLDSTNICVNGYCLVLEIFFILFYRKLNIF